MNNTLTKNQDSFPLTSLLEKPLSAVNDFLFGEIGKTFPLIHDISHHIIASGGKRLRPLLTLASAEMCGYQGDRIIPLAACVELLHTATLLHDDVVDESSMRRGLKTANTLWDNKSSVLVGDFLFSKAFEIMVADGDLGVLKILSSATTQMAEGEVMQMTQAHDIALCYDDYLKIIYGKTACLFEAAMGVGACVAGSKYMADAMDYGRHLGNAFQMMDDVLDYDAGQDLGKVRGEDFREGKMTLPFIFAYEMDADKDFWERVSHPADQKPDDLTSAQERMRRLGVFDRVRNEALKCVKKAESALSVFPASDVKESLIVAAYESVNRQM